MKHQATREIWTQRVHEWKASGLSAATFGEQHNISASMLYNWACRLRNRTTDVRPFPIARVLRTTKRVCTVQAIDRSVIIEIAAARVVISPGFDKTILADVVDVLSAYSQRGGQ